MGDVHTTCSVCGKGLDLADSKRCPICRNFVHADCYNEDTKCCEECSED